MTALKGASLQSSALLLTQAKSADLSSDQLLALKGMVNNSIVGASKLLHFIAPARYPIWDSRIYEFLKGKKGWGEQVNKVDSFVAYRRNLMELIAHPRFAAFHVSVNDKVGYQVSELRALELMMFLAVRS